MVTANTDTIAFSAKPLSRKWTPAMDGELAVLVQRVCEAKAGRSSVDVSPSEICVESEAMAMQLQGIATVPVPQLRMRFALLRELNRALKGLLPCFQLNSTRQGSTGHLLRSLGRCVFFDLKQSILRTTLSATRATSGSSVGSIRLDNFKASLSETTGDTSIDTSQHIFVQAFEQLHEKPASGFRRTQDEDRVFHVSFEGESGIDAGGVYREGLQRMIEDIFSTRLELLVPCPNAARHSGDNMGSYVPNPALTSKRATDMFEFVGRMMGVSLRFNAGLPFYFPSLVWKPLAGEEVVAEDLLSVDSLYGQYIHAIRHCDKDFSLDNEEHAPITTDAEFEEAFGAPAFVTNNAAGEEVELLPGGKDMRVTFTNRHRFCDLVEQFRLHEFDAPIAAIRRGMAGVIPIRALSLFTWQQCEELVAGRPDIDIELLKRMTRYEGGYSASHAVIRRFWRVFESLTNDERSKYVRFAWGRARLPSDTGAWTSKHTLQMHSGGDNMLPQAHTCFFSIELPAYSTDERMSWALRTAIHFGLAGILNG
jgi:hypothetical protein